MGCPARVCSGVLGCARLVRQPFNHVNRQPLARSVSYLASPHLLPLPPSLPPSLHPFTPCPARFVAWFGLNCDEDRCPGSWEDGVYVVDQDINAYYNIWQAILTLVQATLGDFEQVRCGRDPLWIETRVHGYGYGVEGRGGRSGLKRSPTIHHPPSTTHPPSTHRFRLTPSPPTTHDPPSMTHYDRTPSSKAGT